MNWKSALYTVGAVTLLTVVGTSGHIPGAPATSSQPEECQVSEVASEGQPPAAAPRFSPQQLCGALEQAEAEAACMGDWTPPEGISARQFCIELKARGCGNTQRDCDRIPADQTYYYRH